MKAFGIPIVLSAFYFISSPVFAGGGVIGGSTEITQLMNNAELVQQVSQLSQQINNQITMINDLRHNTLLIPDQLFRDPRGIYSDLKGVMSRTQGLSYNAANISEELKRRLKSYGDMGTLSSASDFSAEYQKIATTRMETVRSTMEAIGVSFEALENDASALKELQNKAKTAEGRNQLAQAANQILGFLAEESMRLRQTQMMQVQMIGAVYEAQRAQEDLSKKNIERFFKRGTSGGLNISNESFVDRLGDPEN
ncbi:MAG: P-type conjugative transfer protein TrbJ [Synergistaceae bacterium]|nr:P-type conjugative transfer protein TrbJ [Synergistaceae bacterium]